MRRAARYEQENNSKLANYLMTQLAWGIMSAVQVQKIVALAKGDMEKYAQGETKAYNEISKIAAAGANGTSKQILSRELVTNFRDSLISALCQVIMPFVDLQRKAIHAVQNIFLPHVWLADMYKNSKPAFTKYLSGPTGTLSRFWAAMQGNPILLDHPILKRSNYQCRAIPIAVHGDAVPTTGIGKSWGKSMTVYSWCSMLSKGCTKDLNFYIWDCFEEYLSKQRILSRNTKHIFWKVITWSLRWMYIGLWPDRDWQGKVYTGGVNKDRALTPLAGDSESFYFGVVWALKHDLEHQTKEYSLPDFNAVKFCALCPCVTTIVSDLVATNFRLTAAWMQSLYTKEDWKDHPNNTHLIVRLDGVTILNVMVDAMHCLHLGVAQYFCWINFSIVVFLSHARYRRQQPECRDGKH